MAAYKALGIRDREAVRDRLASLYAGDEEATRLLGEGQYLYVAMAIRKNPQVLHQPAVELPATDRPQVGG